MKNERAKTRDLDTLSAYLDDTLKDSEQKQLEMRLEQEPELRERLELLRMTKVMVGSLTRLHAPRNFTLTPDMVDVRRGKRQPLFTFLRLASSLAAILLVVMFGVELLFSGGLPTKRQMAAEPMMEAARIAEDTTPEPLILWAKPGIGGGGGDNGITGMGSDQMFAEAPVLGIESIPLEDQPLEDALPRESPETEVLPMPKADVESFATEELAADDAAPILGINPEQSGEVLSRSVPGGRAEGAFLTRQVGFRWLQFALAVIAVGGGLMLWFLRSKQPSLD